MNLREKQNHVPVRMLDRPSLQSYLNLGRASAERVAAEANAKIKIGNRTLFDRNKLDAYLDTLTEGRSE